MLISGTMILLYLAGIIVIRVRKKWLVGSGPLIVFFSLMMMSEGLNLLRHISVQMLIRNMGAMVSSKYLMAFNSATFFINTVLTIVALYQLVRFAKIYKSSHKSSNDS